MFCLKVLQSWRKRYKNTINNQHLTTNNQQLTGNGKQEEIAKGDDIQERLIQFAARVIRLFDALPRTTATLHISGQLLRCGTAPAAHHAEARSAESPADFIHKLKIAVKELNESEVWIRIIVASGIQSAHMMSPLLDECDQLQRILSSSIKTARRSNQS